MEARASDVESTERPDKVPIFWRQSQGGGKNGRTFNPKYFNILAWQGLKILNQYNEKPFGFIDEKIKF